jgi:hypothetical protein
VRISSPNASDSTLPRTAALTALAMIAFAANSVLCRLALGQQLTVVLSQRAARA